MAAPKKAKAPEPAGESAPMWIVSFADLVTLLFSFFVVLYALEAGPKEQKNNLMAALKIYANVQPDENSEDPVDQIVNQAMGRTLPPRKANAGTSQNPINGAEGAHPEVTAIRDGKAIVTGGVITFPAGKTELDENALAIIKILAEKIRGKNNVVMVKGHVSFDEIPLRLDDPNGMNLSYRRAVNVTEELVKIGIDRKILRPVACGGYEPRKTGVYDDASLRQNRRVEIFTTDQTVSDYFQVDTVPAADRTEKPATAPNTAPASHN